MPISRVKTVGLRESACLAQLPAVENCQLFLHHGKCPPIPHCPADHDCMVSQARKIQGGLPKGASLALGYCEGPLPSWRQRGYNNLGGAMHASCLKC